MLSPELIQGAVVGFRLQGQLFPAVRQSPGDTHDVGLGADLHDTGDEVRRNDAGGPGSHGFPGLIPRQDRAGQEERMGVGFQDQPDSRESSRGPKGHFQGLAFHYSHQGHFAEVAEVSVDAKKKVTLHKMTVVGDIGPVVNLSAAENQVQGAALDGIGQGGQWATEGGDGLWYRHSTSFSPAARTVSRWERQW